MAVKERSVCGRPGRRRFPLLLAACAVLAWAIVNPALALDPQSLMLVPVGRPLPEFALPGIGGSGPGFSSTDLKGEVTLVNVFASWCAPCREEHPVLTDLAERGVPVYGINYKDPPDAAQRWLDRLGDPYRKTGADTDGAVADSLDLFGLPQTLVVDRDGTIAHVHVGAITEADASDTILPLVERLGASAR